MVPWSRADQVLAEKAAMDNGWEIPPVLESSGWLRCASSRFDDQVWIGSHEGGFALACGRLVLLAELGQNWQREDGLPHGIGGVLAPSLDALDSLMRRAAHLARSLPHQVAREFARRTAHLPRSTEAERLVVQRVGQDLFRDALIDYWEGHCAVTRLAVVELLRASHIKPWARCVSDEERLDVYNGLLLAPHLDALFDGGWISFDDAGELLVSPQLPPAAYAPLGLHKTTASRLARLEDAHRAYLAYHRSELLRT